MKNIDDIYYNQLTKPYLINLMLGHEHERTQALQAGTDGALPVSGEEVV